MQVSHDGISASQVELNPKVHIYIYIYCSECLEAQTIEMNALWKQGDKGNRFLRLTCENELCSKKKISLGNWLRLQDDPNSQVLKWLKARAIHQERTRPAHIHAEDFIETQVRLEGSRPQKRKRDMEEDRTRKDKQRKEI